MSITKSIIVLSIVTLIGGATCPAFAQVGAPGQSTTQNQTSLFGYDQIKDALPQSIFGSTDDLAGSFVGQLIVVATEIVAALAIIGLVVSGVMYITAGGDPDKAQKARNNIIWIITGIVVYILAFWFLGVIRGVFTGSG